MKGAILTILLATASVSQAQQFDKPQIDPNIAYVYNKQGLDVFETNVATTSIGHLDYKTKVKLLDGLRGDYTAIEFAGKTGYVDGNFLLNLPVPATADVVKYLTTTLKQVKDPVKRQSKKDTDEKEQFLYVDYFFEGSITLTRKTAYEDRHIEVKFPGMTLQKMFLFASYFESNYEKLFSKFPTKARDEDLPEQKHVTVTTEKGKVKSIKIIDNDGCYFEDTISETKGVCIMISTGGC